VKGPAKNWPLFLYDTRVPDLCHICAKTYGNRQNIQQWSEISSIRIRSPLLYLFDYMFCETRCCMFYIINRAGDRRRGRGGSQVYDQSTLIMSLIFFSSFRISFMILLLLRSGRDNCSGPSTMVTSFFFAPAMVNP